jgi:hypothetical protein
VTRPFALLALGLLAAPARAQDDPKQLAGQARLVLRQYCQRCHSGPNSESGYEWDALNIASMKEGKVLVPGKPDESELHARLAKDTMPPRNIPKRPSEAEREVVRKWIAAGAPEFPKDAGRTPPFLSLETMLRSVRDHLRDADRADRPYLRYFSLTHLYNNPSVSDDDLRLYRAALSKALNSLHWQKAVVVPEPIDKEQTVFAVDVRKLDWDKYDLWREVAALYPYGLGYDNHPDAALRKLDEDVRDLSHCKLPIIRADWFAATATRPPLYHTLLYDRTLMRGRKFDPVLAKQGNPYGMTAQDLYAYLGVDPAAGFRDPLPERIARGGFAKSGVSGQNRMVERNRSKHGALWVSADFKAENPRGKLTRFPLGPRDLFPPGKHPFDRQAFVQDGGEIIFHLPDGLQGYLLVDGKDRRIDAGPIQVVSDLLKTSGTPEVVNGVSCMACHKHGVIPFTDTLRAGAAVFGEAERKVRDLYPEKKVMDELLDQDRQQFLKGLDDAIGRKILRTGANAKKPIEEFAEPVGEVARLHRLGYLDLKAVACELFVADPEQLVKTVGATELKRLGLEPLSKTGGVIGRLEWEAIDGISLMQELALKLRYTPRAEE